MTTPITAQQSNTTASKTPQLWHPIEYAHLTAPDMPTAENHGIRAGTRPSRASAGISQTMSR